MITPAEQRTVHELIASRQLGYSLPREFYCDELIFRADIERIWRRGWLFAGHTCEGALLAYGFPLTLTLD